VTQTSGVTSDITAAITLVDSAEDWVSEHLRRLKPKPHHIHSEICGSCKRVMIFPALSILLIQTHLTVYLLGSLLIFTYSVFYFIKFLVLDFKQQVLLT
jgi:hypothetical protein